MSTQGTLRLTVVEAQLTRDTGTADDLQMDPYVVIKNKSNAARTDTKWDAGKTPKWNETIDVTVTDISDNLCVNVMDENEATNSMIGGCCVKMASMCVEGGLDCWFPVTHQNKPAGQVHLVGEWFSSGSDPVAWSASVSPGLQQVIMQQSLRGSMGASGAAKPAPYQMPNYNFNESARMEAPQWADRQYQNAAAVNAGGFMAQS